MNYFDVNVSIGGWPFRQVPRHTPEDLRADLEALGCLGALVCNNGSILYNDTREANRELAAAIAPHRDFFRGCATLNPLWPQVEKELRQCVELWQFRAVRLLLRYHDYAWRQALELARLAGEMGIPVVVPSEIVDYRQRTRFEPQTAVNCDELGALAEAAPETTFVWLNRGLPEEAPENVYGEYNRWPATVNHPRLLLGSGMPLRAPAAVIKLAAADCDGVQLRKVAVDNFRRLFG